MAPPSTSPPTSSQSEWSRTELQTQAADAAALLTQLFSAHFLDADQQPRPGLVLLALGGLGRGQLHRGSDLDLMLFSTESDSLDEELAASFSHRLWDQQKRPVSLMFRRPADMEACLRDISSTTSLLEGRYLAGDRTAFEALKELLERDFFTAAEGTEEALCELYTTCKLQEYEERVARPENSLSRVDSDLKEGRGGLRDAQLMALLVALRERGRFEDEDGLLPGLHWRSELLKEPLFQVLCEQLEASPEALSDALAVLDRTRAALQYDGSGETVLRRQRHEGVTEALKQRTLFADLFQARRFVDGLCRELVGSRKRRVAPVRGRRQRFEGGLVVVEDQLEWISDDRLTELTGILSVFEQMQKGKCRLSLPLESQIRRQVRLARARGVRPDEATAAELAQAFRSLLSSQSHVAESLRSLFECQVLDLFWPELTPHLFRFSDHKNRTETLFEEGLRALQALEGEGADKDRREAKMRLELFLSLEGRDSLRLALLLEPLSSSGTDAGAAKALLASFERFFGAELSELRFLWSERRHLEHLARTRKILDEGTAKALLRVVEQDGEALTRLYLVTCARLAARSEAAFKPWLDRAVTTLFEQARELLEQPGAGFVSTRDLRGDQLEFLMAWGPEDQQTALRQHLELCPSSYVFESDPMQVLGDLKLVKRAGQSLAVGLEREGEAIHITIVCSHWGHRFVHETGVLSSLWLSILDATAFSRRDGVTIDRFVVTDRAERTRDELLAAVLERLEQCRRGEIDLAKMVREESRKHSRLGVSQGGEADEMSLTIDNDISLKRTVIEFSAPDRLGLLYDLMRVLSREHLSLQFAKISTQNGRALDSFYVTRDGLKVDNVEALRASLKRSYEDLFQEA